MAFKGEVVREGPGIIIGCCMRYTKLRILLQHLRTPTSIYKGKRKRKKKKKGDCDIESQALPSLLSARLGPSIPPFCRCPRLLFSLFLYVCVYDRLSPEREINWARQEKREGEGKKGPGRAEWERKGTGDSTEKKKEKGQYMALSVSY